MSVDTLLSLTFLWKFLLGAFLAYNAVFWLLSRIIHWQEERTYRKDPLILMRMKVPKEDEKAPTKGPIVMEQIFNALYGTYRPIGILSRLFTGAVEPKMSFEIAHIDNQIHFYFAASRKYVRLIQGQIYAQYPQVEMEEVEDYVGGALQGTDVKMSNAQVPMSKHIPSTNVQLSKQIVGQGTGVGDFQRVPTGQACIAEMGLMQSMIWPFKPYDFFVDKEDKTQVETLAGLTSAMAKLVHESDQAWFQVVIRPQRPLWQKFATEAYDLLKKGFFNRWSWMLKWFIRWYPSPWFWHYWLIKVPTTFVMKIMWQMCLLMRPVETQMASMLEKKEVGFSFWEIPNRKLSKLNFQSSIRLGYLSRSGDTTEARIKVEEMAASFNQFQWPEVNGLKIETMADTSTRLGKRLFDSMQSRYVDDTMVLAVDELATIYHLPMWNLLTPNVAWVRSKKLEAPAELPSPKDFDDLTLLGRTNFRGDFKPFGVKMDDRRRHMYIIGKTGMGKSTVLENMIFDDIQKGRGVAVIDPHGELADKVTAMIPPHRVNDVVIFDPSDTANPVSFNMLEVKSPEQRPLVASGLVGVFKKMYAESWGPRLEYILRNCILALTEFEGATLLGIPRMLVDPMYRDKVVENITDPVVRAFWVDEFANMSDKLRVEAISPIQNKVGQFLSSSIIRNILGQPKSSIDIRFAMDTQKIFIVNLSKGKIGEDNSSLLGSMLITKFQLDAMSRADIEAEDRKDFYLYVDEFQNFATDSFATILSEARKYKLNLVMANQYVQQMEEEVMYAVFGNVGSLVTFQVGFDDAEYFSKQFAEVVMPNDIISLPKFTAYIRLLVDNMPTKVFSAVMNPPVPVDMHSALRQKVLKVSRERYGSDKAMVEDKIKNWSAQQVASPEMKKAIEARSGMASGAGVRWRYDRNKAEFEELLSSAGKKFKSLDRKDFEKYDVKDAVNEYVYFIPDEHLLVYSRVDVQGNSFNRKENKIQVFRVDQKDPLKQELVQDVEKAPGWQLGLNKAIGGGFRNPKNKEEMEESFTKAEYGFQLVDRKDFPDLGLEKSLNELVYRLKKDGKELIVVSALDPQGGCFTRNPDQVIKIGVAEGKKYKELKTVKKSLEWRDQVVEALRAL